MTNRFLNFCVKHLGSIRSYLIFPVIIGFVCATFFEHPELSDIRKILFGLLIFIVVGEFMIGCVVKAIANGVTFACRYLDVELQKELDVLGNLKFKSVFQKAIELSAKGDASGIRILLNLAKINLSIEIMTIAEIGFSILSIISWFIHVMNYVIPTEELQLLLYGFVFAASFVSCFIYLLLGTYSFLEGALNYDIALKTKYCVIKSLKDKEEFSGE